MKTTTKQVNVLRVSVVSASSFEAVVARLEVAVSRPHMEGFSRDVAATNTYVELEQIINKAIGVSSLMEFIRFDFGAILRKDHGEKAPRSLRLLVGNPLIAQRMIVDVPDAGSYAPVTILIDERPDGVHLSYDKMASFLSPYGSLDSEVAPGSGLRRSRPY